MLKSNKVLYFLQIDYDFKANKQFCAISKRLRTLKVSCGKYSSYLDGQASVPWNSIKLFFIFVCDDDDDDDDDDNVDNPN